MTRKEAESLRERWVRGGNVPCDHMSLSLERTDTGDFTDTFLCTLCGGEVMPKSTPDNYNRTV